MCKSIRSSKNTYTPTNNTFFVDLYSLLLLFGRDGLIFSFIAFHTSNSYYKFVTVKSESWKKHPLILCGYINSDYLNILFLQNAEYHVYLGKHIFYRLNLTKH